MLRGPSGDIRGTVSTLGTRYKAGDKDRRRINMWCRASEPGVARADGNLLPHSALRCSISPALPRNIS